MLRPTFIAATGVTLSSAVVATAMNGILTAERGIGLASFTGFFVVGWILTVRVSDNAVSWVTLGCAFVGGIWNLGDALRDAGVPAGVPVGTTGFFAFLLLFGVVLPAWFPTGHVLGPRWRWVPSLGAGAWVVIGVGRGLVWVAPAPATAAINDAVEVVGILGLLTASMAAIASLLVRWVRATGTERLQLDWLALAFALIAVGLVDEFALPGESLVSGVVLGLGAIGVPIAIGLAVLHYRLYDVGRILSRTVTYLVLAGLIVGGYSFGAVWLPTRLESENSLFVAATTLGLLMALNPVRRRLTRALDRRFDRTPYDAEQVMEALSRDLHTMTDPEEVVVAWARSAGDALQPASLAVWART